MSRREITVDPPRDWRPRLDQINEAITDMREGRHIRGIIEFD